MENYDQSGNRIFGQAGGQQPPRDSAAVPREDNQLPFNGNTDERLFRDPILHEENAEISDNPPENSFFAGFADGGREDNPLSSGNGGGRGEREDNALPSHEEGYYAASGIRPDGTPRAEQVNTIYNGGPGNRPGPAPVQPGPAPARQGSAPFGNNQPPRKKNTATLVISVIIAVALLLLIVVIGMAIAKKNESKGNAESNAFSSTETTAGQTIRDDSAASETAYSPGEYTVPVEGNLRLREDHSADAKHIMSVPGGTTLTITEIYVDENASDPAEKYWGKTEYKGWTAWVTMYGLSPLANASGGNDDTSRATTAFRLADNADLLTDEEEQRLLQALNEVSERQRFDLVIVTEDLLGGKTPTEYADDYYDDNGYGYGDSHDGALLLISMEDRDWWISTTGYGITALTDYGIESIGDDITPSLSSGNYYKAFSTFISDCDSYVTQAKNRNPVDN